MQELCNIRTGLEITTLLKSFIGIHHFQKVLILIQIKVINQYKNLDTLVTTQKKFLTSMGILQRAEIGSKDIDFSKKTDLFYRIRRLIDEKQMGELFKVMLIKTKNNKIQTGFQSD